MVGGTASSSIWPTFGIMRHRNGARQHKFHSRVQPREEIDWGTSSILEFQQQKRKLVTMTHQYDSSQQYPRVSQQKVTFPYLVNASNLGPTKTLAASEKLSAPRQYLFSTLPSSNPEYMAASPKSTHTVMPTYQLQKHGGGGVGGVVGCGVRRAACGVRRAACGVRRAACGVWRVMRMKAGNVS